MSRGDRRVVGGLWAGGEVWAPPQLTYQGRVALRFTMGTLGANPSSGTSERGDFGVALGCPIPQSPWEV